MLTRKHFELIANALSAAKPIDDNEEKISVLIVRNMTWELCTEKMADALQAANPRFNRQIFFAACGR
jgi:hypothetical protein